VVVYPAQGEPVVLPELLSPSLVLDALSKTKEQIEITHEDPKGL